MNSFLIEENSNIHAFLEGDNSYIPSNELLYLHTHPLVRPNFLTQIDDLVNKVGTKILEKRVTGPVIDNLSKIAIDIGTKMDTPEIHAEEIMNSIRELYQMCIQLDKTI